MAHNARTRYGAVFVHGILLWELHEQHFVIYFDWNDAGH
jgi:hypothetical protein